jgi:hypothetical protein
MKDNWTTRVVGSSVILVPYRRQHVDKYHAWMRDPLLQVRYLLVFTVFRIPIRLMRIRIQAPLKEDWFLKIFKIRVFSNCTIGHGEGKEREQVLCVCFNKFSESVRFLTDPDPDFADLDPFFYPLPADDNEYLKFKHHTNIKFSS